MFASGEHGYLIGGDVVFDIDGFVDVEKSGNVAYVLRDGKETPEMFDPENIAEITSTPMEAVRAERHAEIKQSWMAENGPLPDDGNVATEQVQTNSLDVPSDGSLPDEEMSNNAAQNIPAEQAPESVQEEVLSPAQQRKAKLTEIAQRIPKKGKKKLWTQAKAEDVAEYIATLSSDAAVQQATVDKYIAGIREKQEKMDAIDALELEEDVAFWNGVKAMLAQSSPAVTPVAENEKQSVAMNDATAQGEEPTAGIENSTSVPESQIENTDKSENLSGNSNEMGARLTNEVSKEGKFTLSESTDNDGNRFYQKNGSIDLWDLSPLFEQARRQIAPIRLTERNVNHILDEHKKELGDSEESVIEFLNNVFSNATVLRKARAGGIFVVVNNTKTDKAAIIRLYPSKNGDYYNVESAGYYRKNKWKDSENVIAELSEPTQSVTASDVSKPQVPDEGGRELLNAETAITSAAESTTPVSNEQENSVKSDENTQNGGEKDVIEETREQNRVAEERQQRAGVPPRQRSDYSAALSSGDTEAQKVWEDKWNDFLSNLTNDDVPAIEGTIRGMQELKSFIKAGSPEGYKENSNYKAYDYIEKALKKRKKELEKSSTNGEKSQEIEEKSQEIEEKSQEIEDYSTNNDKKTETPTISQESEQVGEQVALTKGDKWKQTGEPEKFKTSVKKHADSHDVIWRIGKKRYGTTTAERDLLRTLAEDYGSLNAVWNAFELNQIVLNDNEAAILKKLIEANTKKAELQQGTITLDSENPAFARATEQTMQALEKTGIEVVMVAEEQVNEVMGIANAERQMIADANERFNRELQQQIDGTLPKGHIYKLGMPSAVLQSAGLPNLPIELASSRLSDKSMQENHPFDLSEIEGLVESVQNPLAVFRSATHVGSFVVLTEIQHNGRNFVAAIETNRRQGRIEINSVRSIHYRNSNTHIANWIEEGLLEYADKKRMSEWFSKQQYNSADVRNLFRHSAKVIEDFENPKVSTEFSRSAAPFYSNARRAVLDIKQEKATTEQWVAMLKKNGGLKAGEDAWIGLETWLGEQTGTVAKQDILDYLTEHSIQIEEVEYGEQPEILYFEDYDVYNEWQELGGDEEAFNELAEKYGDDFKIAFSFDDAFGIVNVDDAEAATLFGGANNVNAADNAINATRLDYTTEGLENKREIALTVPTIEPYNASDEVHFGDAGGGRAVAWVRFGETTDSEGKRVLVIDEIQSKRHQDGRDKGYRPIYEKQLAIAENAFEESQKRYEDAAKKHNSVNAALLSKYGIGFDGATESELQELRDAYEDMQLARETMNMRKDELVRISNGERGNKVPSAPFEKNWHELAMKRMLRYAAENGFDKVAWTTGEQQAERYDMSRQVESISVEENTIENFSDGTPIAKNITISTTNGPDIRIDTDAEGVIHGGEYGGKHLSDVVGKEFAERIMQPGSFTLEGESLRIGGEGMKGFYDRMLPSFVSKYTKKWGAKVGDVTMPELGENGMTMHSVDVTPAMAESVMQGQPMFLRTLNGTVYGWSVGGRIYLTPDGVNPNTPVHEYTHLWARAIEQRNPELWKQVVDAMKLSPMWSDVMADEAYRDIWNDDNRMASEVLARLSGEENYRRAMERAQAEMKSAMNVVEAAEKISAWERVKRALSDFWNKVKEMLGLPVEGVPDGDVPAWMEFVNSAIGDFYGGMNPNVENPGVEFAKKESERRQEKNRINSIIDEAVGFFTVGGKRQATKERLKRETERKQLTEEIYSSVLKGDFNPLTLERINKYIEDATPANPFGRRISQRLPQRMERTLRQGARTNAVDALFSRICESTVPANERFSEAGRRAIEERKKELLKGWAIATGNWHTDLKEFTDDTGPIGEGKDSKVYMSKDGNSVIKASKGKPFGKKFRPDIDNIPLFNDVFKNSRYEILGYGEIDGQFVRILKQDFIDFAESTPLTPEERVEYMGKLGFKPLNKDYTAFSNGEIIIADLQKGNVVRDAAGNISVIDADAKLHTKDVGGNYTYPAVETDLPQNPEFMFIGKKGAENLDRAEETADVALDDQIFLFDNVENSPMERMMAEDLFAQMNENAELLVPRLLTEDVWKNEIEGKAFKTPIGNVKLGENQYEKNKGKGREREFGMIIPTLERPDFIFEEFVPEEGAERQTKYVFAKAFYDNEGNKHIYYANVSVLKDGMEAVTSSHHLRDKQVLNKIRKEQMLWNRFASDSMSSAQGGSTDQNNALPADKGNNNSSTLQADDDIRFRGYVPSREDLTRAERTSEARKRIKEMTGAKGYGSNSAYAEGLTEDGEKWVIRVSDHAANPDNFEEHNGDADYVLSIVIDEDFDANYAKRHHEPITNDENIWQVVVNPLDMDYDILSDGIERFKRTGDGSYVWDGRNDTMFRSENSAPESLRNNGNELNLQQENVSENEQNQNDIPVGGQISESVPQGEHGEVSALSGGVQETADRLGERIQSAQRNSERGLLEIENSVAREFAQENGLWIENETELGTPFPSGDEHNNYIDEENQVIYKVNNRMHTPSILDLLDRIAQHNKLFPNSRYSLVGFTAISKNGDVWPVFAQDYVPGARMASIEEIDGYMDALGYTRVGDGRYSNGEVVVKDLKPRNVLVNANGDVFVVDAEFETAPEAVAAAQADAEMTDAVNALSKELNTAIDIVTDVDEISDGDVARKRLSKGWYEKGRVVVVLPNATSVDDVVETVLHEVVGHKGLRTLLGEDGLNRFLDDVFAYAPKETRVEIMRRALSLAGNVKGNSVRIATEEYIAELAERGFDAAPSMWERIRDFFRRALRSMGFDVELDDREIRYMLWRSYELQRRGRTVLTDIENGLMEDALNVGGRRYRATAALSPMKAKGSELKTETEVLPIREMYERMIRRGRYQFRESMQDSMLAFS